MHRWYPWWCWLVFRLRPWGFRGRRWPSYADQWLLVCWLLSAGWEIFGFQHTAYIVWNRRRLSNLLPARCDARSCSPAKVLLFIVQYEDAKKKTVCDPAGKLLFWSMAQFYGKFTTCQHPKNIVFKRHVLGWCMCERNKGSKRRWVRTRPSLRFASR